MPRRRTGKTTRKEHLTTRTEIPQIDKEMSDLGGVRKVRFGLASKFTIPVSIVLSVTIVLMGFVVYGKTSDSLKLQLTGQGVFAARIAAAPEILPTSVPLPTCGTRRASSSSTSARRSRPTSRTTTSR